MAKLTLDYGKYGFSITDETNKITYAERNMSERKEFHKLYGFFEELDLIKHISKRGDNVSVEVTIN